MHSVSLRVANLMLLLLGEMAVPALRFFQTANGVSGFLAKSEKIRVQLVPQHHSGLLMEILTEIHRQRPVAGAHDIFTQLLLVRCENADAASPA
jgi:hypothetical protein